MLSQEALHIKDTSEKGRGVFTRIEVKKGTIIEQCPILKIPKAELPIIHRTILHDYYFLWGEELDQAVIALGYGSIYNHAIDCNADFILDFTKDFIEIVAIDDIKAGEEITINYHGEPGEEEKVWFDIVE